MAYEPVPVVDIFSGPGGLSEGFSRYATKDWLSVLDGRAAGRRSLPSFRVCLSVEKDEWAHRTLMLRTFFRQFAEADVPEEYYEVVRGQRRMEALFSAFPKEGGVATREAWHAELGELDNELLDARIKSALKGRQDWVLVGGPPCQAYSVAGRSRNRGNAGYRAAKDGRHFLYEEYLRIVAKHEPPVFVMENVTGILSSRVGRQRIFDRILDDLHQPGARGRNKRLRYSIYPLVNAAKHESEPPSRDNFILEMERCGIPQSRHRVILVGIRDDIRAELSQLRDVELIAAKAVLKGLPRIRSGLSQHSDSRHDWLTVIRNAASARWLLQLPDPGLRQLIKTVARSTAPPKNDRGSAFIEGKTSTIYAREWFSDSRVQGVSNHESRAHFPPDIHRYLFAACFAQHFGRSPKLSDFPKALLPEHANVADALSGEGMFEDRFRVQIAGRPATTVVSHIAKDGHYYIHYDPTQCRSLTVREAARLQTFPDNYYFCGPRTEQYAQIGNAVPPLLAVQVADLVAKLLGQLAVQAGVA